VGVGVLIVRVKKALLSSHMFCKCSLSMAFLLREHEIFCVHITPIYMYWLILKNVGNLFVS